MRQDYLGNPVTGEGAATLAAIDDFVGGFLGYEQRLVNVVAAADSDPGSCLANAYAGWVCMFLESPAAPRATAPYLARAQHAAGGATPREQLAVEVLKAWARDDIDAALRHADAILALAPRDLAALKLHQYFNFCRGRAGEMLRVAVEALPHAADVAALHGMLAFAYEQCHRLPEAEAAARHALRMQPKEPWAEHALAHVMLGEGRTHEGIGFLTGAAGGWTRLTSFMDTHLWWHLALFLITEGRLEEALGIYDRHVWARDKSYSQDQVGAVSLLARIELAGGAVGERWHELGSHLIVRRADTVQPFLSLQYLYGLARAGRPEASELLAAIRRRALDAPPGDRAVWSEVALPAAEGLIAHARGDARAAHRGLHPALERLVDIGGSHAQRDLFLQLNLDSLIRAEEWSVALPLLEARRAFESDGVPLNRVLARAYAALGRPDEAQRATDRARRPAP